MRSIDFRFAGVVALCLALGELVVAQQRARDEGLEARHAAVAGRTVIADEDRNGVPVWENPPGFKSDVFTFVRVRYNTEYGGRSWITDFPDSDLNFSFRLQQMTSLKVDPRGKILSLTDPELFDYPFIYMLEVSSLRFTDEEVVALRRYLLNGGFLMVDDFWGKGAWVNFSEQLKRVFPDREAQELSFEHPIFHCVFNLPKIPQIPGIEPARRFREEGQGRTWERPDDPDPHYRALFDDNGRMMALICHNTDLGDGWEREGEEEWYFHEFSEKLAYPMGINIVYYAMTH
jgi:hypothetical protein